MTVREARAAAVRRRYRDLCDSLTEALPLLLDELDAIDRAHVPDMVAVKNGLDPTDAELAAWVERNPKAFADWAARQARTAPARPVLGNVTSVSGGAIDLTPTVAPPVAGAAPAKPARAARRPRGGTAT